MNIEIQELLILSICIYTHARDRCHFYNSIFS